MTRNPLKEFFSFTKSERQGIFVLLLIIALLLLTNILLPHLLQKEHKSEFEKFVEEVKAFEKQYQSDTVKANNLYYKKQPKISEEDLAIYSIETNEYEQPYEKQYEFKPYAKDYTKKEYSVTRLNINLNTADTTELMQLRGIGSTFANRIIKYREKLGGYFTTEQLLEVYGFDSVKYNTIKEQIFIEDGSIRKFNLNSAEVKELVNHPYIDYKLANAISKQRFKKKFESVDELKNVYLVNDSLFRKLAPYFSTE
mgnify:CR=1 FL=1